MSEPNEITTGTYVANCTPEPGQPMHSELVEVRVISSIKMPSGEDLQVFDKEPHHCATCGTALRLVSKV